MGNINWNRDIAYDSYTIDIGLQVTLADYDHQVLSNMYLTRGNQVIYDVMKGVTADIRENITDPSEAHTYPKIPNLDWQNGRDS